MRNHLCVAVLAAASVVSLGAHAQERAYLGQIIATSGSFCPSGWRVADGAIMPVAENMALFYIVGNKYGGDGKTTFALPNLKDVKLGNQPVTWCIALSGVFPQPN